MNPRGNQYALAGTLSAWTRLTEPTPKQRRALHTTYLGLNPRTYGRYGRTQWRAPLPTTRIVIKDPFAMLSVPCITAVTGARGVQLYRHPGAVLASYRRMGWRPDLAEMSSFGDAATTAGPLVAKLWGKDPSHLGDTDAMGVFWSILTTIALDDMEQTPGTVMVSHQEIAAGGRGAGERLFAELGLEFSRETALELGTESPGEHTEQPAGRATADSGTGMAPDPRTARALHSFDRNPVEVAKAWRKHVTPADLTRIELITAPVRERAELVRLRLSGLQS
jgi:hypothetical protein